MNFVDKDSSLDSRRASDAFRVLSRGSGALTSAQFVEFMLDDPSPCLKAAQ